MSIDAYLALRNRAGSLPDLGDYRSHAAEMNPAIFERFIEEVKNAGLLGVIWEPFAGTSYPKSLANSYIQDSVLLMCRRHRQNPNSMKSDYS